MTDLFTLTELASYLQRDLDTASATLARAAAQSIVRGYCKQELTDADYTAVILPIEPVDWSWGVYLPERPVTAVTSVAVNGTVYVEGTDYAWDGYSDLIRLRYRVFSTDAFQVEPHAVVSYSAGFATVPETVKAVALAVASRQYDNPTGNRSVQLDDYAATKAGADEDLAGASLLAGEKLILRDFKRRAGTVTPR